jgi:hypothetical protein
LCSATDPHGNNAQLGTSIHCLIIFSFTYYTPTPPIVLCYRSLWKPASTGWKSRSHHHSK